MPEVAEVKLSSDFVSKHSTKKFVKIEKSPVSKVKTDLSVFSSNHFHITSISRGKEMVIDFADMTLEPGVQHECKRLKVTLGMSGCWVYYNPNDEKFSKWHKHVHLRLIDDKGNILGLYDVRRFAKWTWGNFDANRSPCPLSEPLKFGDNLRENWYTHRDFQRHKLSEIMLSQRWFNGVGNYLRAEILHRLDTNPFKLASELPLEKLNDLIAFTVGCSRTAYALGGGQLKDWKNPEGTDPTSFKEWIKCYGLLESCVDSTGRTFWFDKKWKT